MNGFVRIAPISKWPTLASAVLVTILAVAYLIRGATISDTVYARGPAGSDLTLATATEQRLVVLAAPAGSGEVTCGEGGTVPVRYQMLGGEVRELEGERYAYLGRLSSQWQPGDVLRCSGGGAEEILVVTDAAGSARTAGVMIGLAAAVLWIWTVVTFLVARSARRSSL